MLRLILDEVKVTWMDGGLLPSRPEELPEGVPMGRDLNGGCLFVGTKGKLMCGCYGKNPFILGREDNPPKVSNILRRVETSHEMDWIRACKESKENRVEPSSNFDYSGTIERDGGNG